MANADGGTLAEDSRRMSSDLIVSYDGTPNDDDALAPTRGIIEHGVGHGDAPGRVFARQAR